MSARHDWWPCVTTAVRTYRHRVNRPNLPPRVAQEVQAVEDALELYPPGSPQRQLIGHRLAGDTLTQAALKTGYSVDRARYLNRMYLHEVARNLGYKD